MGFRYASIFRKNETENSLSQNPRKHALSKVFKAQRKGQREGYSSLLAATIPRAAAHSWMFSRLIAAAIRSGNWSGVQAKHGMPRAANWEATL